jgi:hypothetical protein
MGRRPVTITILKEYGNEKEEYVVFPEQAIQFRAELDSTKPFVDLWIDEDEFVTIAKSSIKRIKFDGLEEDDLVETEEPQHHINYSFTGNMEESARKISSVLTDYLRDKMRKY